MQITHTDSLLAILNSVNKEVNKKPYESDSDRWGVEDYWTSKIMEVGTGDCDDYALSKRHILIHEHGLPWQALQPTICKFGGEGHLVLLVATDKGYLILDNLSDRIKMWPSTMEYEWLYRLDGERGWVNFNG